MRIKIDRYRGNKAFGEVSSIDGVEVSIYVYPEKYQNISIGNVVILNSGSYYPVIIIHRNLHRARREQSFYVLRMGHEDLESIYPDAITQYIYVVSGIMVGYCNTLGEVNWSIGPPPRLHDLSYLIDRDDLENLLLVGGNPNFRWLENLIRATNDTLVIKEFFIKNREVLRDIGDPKKVFMELFISLFESGLRDDVIKNILKSFIEVVGEEL